MLKLIQKMNMLDLKTQDRNKWSFPLIQLGNAMMNKAVEENEFSIYHYEAAIIAEHIKASSFKQTNWSKILQWYQFLYKLQPNPSHLLSMAVVCLQNKNYIKANYYFDQLQPEILEQRSYLFYSAKADYYNEIKNKKEALKNITIAIKKVTNKFEKEYLEKKKTSLLS